MSDTTREAQLEQARCEYEWWYNVWVHCNDDYLIIEWKRWAKIIERMEREIVQIAEEEMDRDLRSDAEKRWGEI